MVKVRPLRGAHLQPALQPVGSPFPPRLVEPFYHVVELGVREVEKVRSFQPDHEFDREKVHWRLRRGLASWLQHQAAVACVVGAKRLCN